MKKRLITGILLASLVVLGWVGGILNKKQTSERTNQNENIELAIYLNETETSEIPSYTSGYLFDEEASSCTSDATLRWDNETWSPIIQNIENYPVRCEIHFTSYCETHKEEAACEILAKGETDELKFDRTKDNNLRYVGSNPNNYVSFNSELWRIIGVMNNINDGKGIKETRLKLIRNEEIGVYSWDYNSDGTSDNDWATSTLMELLNNGAYYNRTTGVYFNNDSTATVVDFSNMGLTEEAKSMIGEAVWNLGAVYEPSFPAKEHYNMERSNVVSEGNKSEWVGKIGLPYTSDYEYATSGGANTSRPTCLTTGAWRLLVDCYINDWLQTTKTYWAISARRYNTTSVINICASSIIELYGTISDYFAYGPRNVFPSVYLSNNVQIVSGSGSSTDPYILIKQ